VPSHIIGNGRCCGPLRRCRSIAGCSNIGQQEIAGALTGMRAGQACQDDPRSLSVSAGSTRFRPPRTLSSESPRRIPQMPLPASKEVPYQ
jgi:hypothetical protein